MSNKATRFLRIAEDLLRRAKLLASGASSYLRSTGYELKQRDRVAIALVLKIDASFRALLDDCRAQRREAMHHLKTMVEAFIYFHATLNDESNTTAAQILADKVAEKHAEYLKDAGAKDDDIKDWKGFANELRQEAARLGSLIKVAERDTGLRSWYGRVYRLACEAAHVGDLLELMPSDRREIVVGRPSPGDVLRSDIAIRYAVYLVIGVFETLNERSDPGVPRVSVDDLRRAAEKIDQDSPLPETEETP
jgi:hypothetical protein